MRTSAPPQVGPLKPARGFARSMRERQARRPGYNSAEVGPPGAPPQRHPSPFPPGLPVPRASVLLTAVLAVSTIVAPVRAQQGDPALLTIRRIYASGEFAPEPFGPARWLEDGTAYTTL